MALNFWILLQKKHPFYYLRLRISLLLGAFPHELYPSGEIELPTNQNGIVARILLKLSSTAFFAF